eukprot:g20319.t1
MGAPEQDSEGAARGILPKRDRIPELDQLYEQDAVLERAYEEQGFTWRDLGFFGSWRNYHRTPGAHPKIVVPAYDALIRGDGEHATTGDTMRDDTANVAVAVEVAEAQPIQYGTRAAIDPGPLSGTVQGDNLIAAAIVAEDTGDLPNNVHIVTGNGEGSASAVGVVPPLAACREKADFVINDRRCASIAQPVSAAPAVPIIDASAAIAVPQVVVLSVAAAQKISGIGNKANVVPSARGKGNEAGGDGETSADRMGGGQAAGRVRVGRVPRAGPGGYITADADFRGEVSVTWAGPPTPRVGNSNDADDVGVPPPAAQPGSVAFQGRENRGRVLQKTEDRLKCTADEASSAPASVKKRRIAGMGAAGSSSSTSGTNTAAEMDPFASLDNFAYVETALEIKGRGHVSNDGPRLPEIATDPADEGRMIPHDNRGEQKIRGVKKFTKTSRNIVDEDALQLNLKPDPFEVMVTGEKKQEFRDFSDYWTERLVSRENRIQGNTRTLRNFKQVAFRIMICGYLLKKTGLRGGRSSREPKLVKTRRQGGGCLR